MRAVARWLANRSARWLLVAAWVTFIVVGYPGYMSYDSVVQLGEVRSGVYTDASAPLMTFMWSAAEWIVAGPASMLALQSGLALVGLAALFRRILSPRAAVIAAACVLLFPPVASPVAVIWPHSMAACALLAAAGAALSPDRRWRIGGGCALVLALACRPELAVAAVPIAALAFSPSQPRARRFGLAVATVIIALGAAELANTLLVDIEYNGRATALQVTDTIGTLQRARARDPRALAGLTVIDREHFAERVAQRHDTYDALAATAGRYAIIEMPATMPERVALGAAWRRSVASHPGAYAMHRVQLARRLLGIGREGSPIYDSFGDPDLLRPLHHRATPSDVQVGYRAIAHALEPLYLPLLWLLAAIAALVVVRERAVRAVLASGIAWAATLLVLAPSTEYRFAHWIVVAGTVGLAAAIGARTRWRA